MSDANFILFYIQKVHIQLRQGRGSPQSYCPNTLVLGAPTKPKTQPFQRFTFFDAVAVFGLMVQGLIGLIGKGLIGKGLIGLIGSGTSIIENRHHSSCLWRVKSESIKTAGAARQFSHVIRTYKSRWCNILTVAYLVFNTAWVAKKGPVEWVEL